MASLQVAPVVPRPDKNPLDVFAQNITSMGPFNPQPSESQALLLKQLLVGKLGAQAIGNEGIVNTLNIPPQSTPDVPGAPTASSFNMLLPLSSEPCSSITDTQPT